MLLNEKIKDTILWDKPEWLRCFIDIGFMGGEFTLGTLSERWGMTKSATRNVIDKLARYGLIAKTDKGADINPEYIGGQVVKEKKTNAEKMAECDARKRAFEEHLRQFECEFGADMVANFFRYWSEKNKSGTKMRWEQQTTWETKKRLITWRNNNKKYGAKNELAFQDAVEQRHRIESIDTDKSIEERIRKIEGGGGLLI